MINEIYKALQETRDALEHAENDDTIEILKKLEQRLNNWLIKYEDDGK